jgi:hypothetical protein
MNYEPPLDDPIATGAVRTGVGEHDGYTCEQCGSDWIRYEHLDAKDCTPECEDPCNVRCCNEEQCAGGVNYKDPDEPDSTYDTMEERE